MFNNVNYHGFWYYQNILERFVTRRHEWCPTCQRASFSSTVGQKVPGGDAGWIPKMSRTQARDGAVPHSTLRQMSTMLAHPTLFPCPQLVTQAPPQSQDSSCLSSTSSSGKNWPSPSPAQHPEEAWPHLMPQGSRQDIQPSRSGCCKLLRGLHLIPGVTGGSRMIRTCGYKG